MRLYQKVLLTGCLSLLCFTSCEEPLPEQKVIRPVRAIEVTKRSQQRAKLFPGVARAEHRVNLSFRVNGPLIHLPINVGDLVKKGEVVAQIDPKDYEVDLKTKLANLEKAKAALSFADNDYQRALNIQNDDPGAISESLVDQKREQANRLRAEVVALSSQVEGARDRLYYTQLKAPFNGRIVAKYFDNFEYVQANQPVVRILDTSRIEMVVDVPERMISLIPLVEKITVTLEPMPDLELEASIKEVGSEASTLTRTYPVTLIMPQPEEITILAGMSGEAEFVGTIPVEEGKEASLLIPTTAIFSNDQEAKTFVWVIDTEKETVSKREITLEKISSEGTFIKSGLNVGEWIATAGVHFLNEGDSIHLLKDEKVP